MRNKPIRFHNEVHVLLVKLRPVYSRIEPIAALGVLAAPIVEAPISLFKAGMMHTSKPCFVVLVAATIFLTVVGPLPLRLRALITLLLALLLLLALGLLLLLFLLLLSSRKRKSRKPVRLRSGSLLSSCRCHLAGPPRTRGKS